MALIIRFEDANNEVIDFITSCIPDAMPQWFLWLAWLIEKLLIEKRLI